MDKFRCFLLLLFFIFMLSCSVLEADQVIIPTPIALKNTTISPTIIPISYDATQPTPQETSVTAHDEAPVVIASENNGQLAYAHLVMLSQEIGARLPGSAHEKFAADYIHKSFEEIGYSVQTMPFDFYDEYTEVDLTSTNIIIIKQGRSSEEIILGAHYDSMDEGLGADDNASGVGVLLEMAEKLFDVPTPYTIRFIAFGAEENNLDGSRIYVEQMSRESVQNTLLMINLDGLIAGNYNYIYSDQDELIEWTLTTAARRGFDLRTIPVTELDYPDGTPCMCADYSHFQQSGIPFAFFEAADWTIGDMDGELQVALTIGDEGLIRHTTFDNIAYIDKFFPGRINERLTNYVILLNEILTSWRE